MVKVCAAVKTPDFWKVAVRRGRGGDGDAWFVGEKMVMSMTEEKVCRAAWARGGDAGFGVLFRIMEGWPEKELCVLM